MLNKPKILIVDDDNNNLKLLYDILSFNKYEVIKAENGPDCLSILNKQYKTIDLILLDIMMPGMDGYEVCKKIKANSLLQEIPIFFLTGLTEDNFEVRGLSAGAVDYISKPINESVLLSRIKTHVKLKKYQDQLCELVEKRTIDLENAQSVIVDTFATLAEFRDPETGHHIIRTMFFLKELANELAKTPKYSKILDSNQIFWMTKAAPLHDIGKVAIRDHILLKPGKLTHEEFEIMKKHTIYGKEAIESTAKKLTAKNDFLRYGIEIAIGHHEKWNGEGYPYGLKGSEIPLSARIMALADVYDALRSKRVYKKAFSHETAKKMIIDETEKQFDPDIVEAFVKCESKFIEIANKYKDD